MNTTTYSVNAIDSDAPSAWMGAAHIVSCVPGAQDSGRCRYTVITTDPQALEDALEAAEDVLQYEAQ